jgi:hypothetical protein
MAAMGLIDFSHFFLVQRREPIPTGTDVSTCTYRCTECGSEVKVDSVESLPPCLVCKRISWVEVSGPSRRPTRRAGTSESAVHASGVAQAPAGSREERIAENEDLCRDLNERKAEWIESGHLAAGFRCECWDLGCRDRIQMSGGQWKEVRSRGNRFVVAPGHVLSEFEKVVKEYPHFWLIEKHGEAGEDAEALA